MGSGGEKEWGEGGDEGGCGREYRGKGEGGVRVEEEWGEVGME